MFNPMQLMMQGMLQKMQSSDPQLFGSVQQMVQGKNETQLMEMAQNIARERGVDLQAFASQFGIKL